nr:PhzF family phenazine biosynthesis protein [Actinomyces sp.]
MSYRFRQVDVFGDDPCTGNPLAVVLDAEGLSVEQVRRFAVWSNLSECIFVLPLAQPGADADWGLRAFFTDGDGPLREDPVTGSLNAAVAQYLVRTGRASLPYAAAQGTVMGRRGRVYLSGEDGETWVGGRGQVFVPGQVEL